jgi:hypothetical protein
MFLKMLHDLPRTWQHFVKTISCHDCTIILLQSWQDLARISPRACHDCAMILFQSWQDPAMIFQDLAVILPRFHLELAMIVHESWPFFIVVARSCHDLDAILQTFDQPWSCHNLAKMLPWFTKILLRFCRDCIKILLWFNILPTYMYW